MLETEFQGTKGLDNHVLFFRCVIRGCVPKKILVYGASFGGELEVNFHLFMVYK